MPSCKKGFHVSVFDRYKYYAASPESPVSHAFVVTPDDSADLTHVTRALYVGCGGDLRVVMADGATVTFAALAVGWHPVRVRRLLATGTSATLITGAIYHLGWSWPERDWCAGRLGDAGSARAECYGVRDWAQRHGRRGQLGCAL
ncbi:MAG: hypothetical protein ACI9U6_000067 [Loktanella salsilacus]